MDQTYCQNQGNVYKTYHKTGTKNTIYKTPDKISISAVGIQAINGNSFVSFLDNTKTFEMMKFMVQIVIKNIENTELKLKLKEIIYNEKLFLENILDTVNEPENYNILLKTLKDLSNTNESIRKLYEYVERNEGTIHTISKQRLENLQKTMLLAYFNNKKLQHQLIMEKPLAVILDNYSVHHAIVFTRLCNILNMDLIFLPPYSPKYNPIEQVWRTIKMPLSIKNITSLEELIKYFKNEFYEVVDRPSFWKGWVRNVLWGL